MMRRLRRSMVRYSRPLSSRFSSTCAVEMITLLWLSFATHCEQSIGQRRDTHRGAVHVGQAVGERLDKEGPTTTLE